LSAGNAQASKPATAMTAAMALKVNGSRADTPQIWLDGVSIPVRKRAQQSVIQYAEDHGGGAYSEGQRENSQQNEAAIPAKIPPCEA
jgi:Tfp pilus assembly protein PilX